MRLKPDIGGVGGVGGVVGGVVAVLSIFYVLMYLFCTLYKVNQSNFIVKAVSADL